MNCPHCGKDMKEGIYKDIEGTILGTVQVLNASETDADEEGEEEWDTEYSEIERTHTGNYACYSCDAYLEDEIVYAHFRGDDKPTYKDTQTLSLFREGE